MAGSSKRAERRVGDECCPQWSFIHVVDRTDASATSHQYPGMVACRVELYFESGDRVGQEIWQLSALEPESRQPDLLVVEVSGEPRAP